MADFTAVFGAEKQSESVLKEGKASAERSRILEGKSVDRFRPYIIFLKAVKENTSTSHNAEPRSRNEEKKPKQQERKAESSSSSVKEHNDNTSSSSLSVCLVIDDPEDDVNRSQGVEISKDVDDPVTSLKAEYTLLQSLEKGSYGQTFKFDFVESNVKKPNQEKRKAESSSSRKHREESTSSRSKADVKDGANKPRVEEVFKEVKVTVTSLETEHKLLKSSGKGSYGQTSEFDSVEHNQVKPKQQKRKAESAAASPPPKRRKDNACSGSASVYVVISDADDDANKPQDEEKSKEANVTLTSLKAKYTLLQPLGKGNYGQVVKCLNEKTKEIAAMKITKKRDYLEESVILQEIMRLNMKKVPIVQVLDLFQCGGKGCMVFELLEQSLLQFIRHQPVPIEGVCRISFDLLSALAKLQQMGIIHADIKPDNIMLVNHARKPFSVKLIDFGLAVKKNSLNYPKNVQSLCYRSPEILLDLRYSEAIDVWSAGCVVGAVLTRHHLYPGRCEYDMMRLIHGTHGIPPLHMLKWNMKATLFFGRTRTEENTQNGVVSNKWRLRTPEEYYCKRDKKSWEIGKSIVNSLEEAVEINFKDTIENGVKTPQDTNRRKLCTNLLKKMLQVDPKKRINPSEALNHSFFNSTAF